MKATVIDICVKDPDHEIFREEAHKLLQSIVRDSQQTKRGGGPLTNLSALNSAPMTGDRMDASDASASTTPPSRRRDVVATCRTVHTQSPTCSKSWEALVAGDDRKFEVLSSIVVREYCFLHLSFFVAQRGFASGKLHRRTRFGIAGYVWENVGHSGRSAEKRQGTTDWTNGWTCDP